MKKLFRKIGALLMTVVMVLGVCAAVFAADENPTITPAPTSNDHATIIGIEDGEGVVVTAYKIAKYNSDTGKYEPVLEKSIENIESIKASELIALEGRTSELVKENASINISRTDGEGNYVVNNPEDKITAGVWMIIVSGSTKNLYNPAILSVMQGETAETYNYGTLNYDNYTWSSEVYVKKAEPEITKTAEIAKSDSNQDANGVQVGDILKFTVTGDIPNYTVNDKSIVYKISDTLEGLTLVTTENDGVYIPTVTVEGASDDDNKKLDEKVKESIKEGQDTFMVDLAGNSTKKDETDNGWDSWLQKNAGKKIVLTYYAKVSSAAKINVEKKTNTAKLEYSTNGETTQSKEAKTIHYTFGIDTGFNGEATETGDEKTGEFIKTSGGTVNYVEKDKKITVSVDAEHPLGGAEFQLYIKKDDTGKNDVQFNYGSTGEDHHYTTDADGRLEINGLDSEVDYYLIETKAPSGYSKISTKIPVRIDAVYDPTTKELKNYTVSIGGKTTSYKYTDNGTVKTEIINTEENPSNPFGFKNEKIGTLPSTGGIGTYIFTIIGVMVMAAVTGMFLVSRAKDKKINQ